jgi:cAMP-dependent protein kinase regulator
MAAGSEIPTPIFASAPPSSTSGDSSVDQALALLLADQTEAALRWSAAALERDLSTSSALVVTARLLQRVGRTRAAIEGLQAAVKRAIEAGDLPLAIAAIDELRALGEDVSETFERVSETFCKSSPRLDEASPPLSPHFDDFQPLSAFLAGPALATKAAQIVEAAKRADDGATPAELPPVDRLPLFGALPKDALRDLLAAFDVITVPAGRRVMEEGELGTAAYVVVRGELVLLRASGARPPAVLARLGRGAFFGEMALLSDMPRAASAVATRPSILMVATRAALQAVARRHPVVASELAAHCHRRLVANLGRMAPILAALPPGDRALVEEKFVTRIYRKGERLTTKGEETGGLHLLASGAVAIVAHDDRERVVLATLSPGETIGEVELVLCRRASADAIALQPTVTLFLSREDFASLTLDHPALVHGLYMTAIKRDGETAQALESAAFAASDYQLDERVADESLLSEEARLEAVAAHEIERATASAEDPQAAATSRPAVTSVPPPLPPVSATAAQSTAVEQPAAFVEAVASAVDVPLSARGTDVDPSKSAPASRSSSVSPLTPSAPPVGSSPPSPRARPLWELPPVAVLGVSAAVACVGFALAAPFGNHVNAAVASGGVMQDMSAHVDVPVEPRSRQPTLESAPVLVAPATLPFAPAKTEAPAPRSRPMAAIRVQPATLPAAIDPTPASAAATPPGSATPSPPSAAVVAQAPRPDSKAAIRALPFADEFGGRE